MEINREDFFSFCWNINLILNSKKINNLIQQSPVRSVEFELGTLIQEAWASIDLITNNLDRRNILEVGSGIGLVNFYFQTKGLKIVSLEPSLE